MTVIAGESWTCSRCGLRIGYLPGREPAGLPPGMSELDGALLCLGCRRSVIVARAEAEWSGGTRGHRRFITGALARDELERDAGRSDQAIAKSLGCPAHVVREERTARRSKSGETG